MKPRSITMTFLISALALSLLIVARLLWPFAQPMAFALILGLSLFPFHRRVLARLKSKNWAALVSTLAVFLLVLVPVGAITYVVSAEMVQAGRYFAGSNSEAGLVPATQRLAHRALAPLGILGAVSVQRVDRSIETFPQRAGDYLINAGTLFVGGIAGFAGATLVTFFVLFFLFRDGEQMAHILAFILPISERHSQRLFRDIRKSIVANLYGMAAVAVVQALVSWPAYMVLGLPSALMLAALTGVSSLLPVVGTAVVWVPLALYLGTQGHLLKCFLLLLWGVLVIAGSDNLVRAKVVQGEVAMHPLLVIFSILGGIEVFGFIGLFIGPLMLSVTVALIDMLRDEIIAEKMAKMMAAGQ